MTFETTFDPSLRSFPPSLDDLLRAVRQLELSGADCAWRSTTERCLTFDKQLLEELDSQFRAFQGHQGTVLFNRWSMAYPLTRFWPLGCRELRHDMSSGGWSLVRRVREQREFPRCPSERSMTSMTSQPLRTSLSGRSERGVSNWSPCPRFPRPSRFRTQ